MTVKVIIAVKKLTVLVFFLIKKSTAAATRRRGRRRRMLAEGAVLALHGDAGEQVEGSKRVGAWILARDVAGQRKFLHEGLALSEGSGRY